MDYSGFRNFPFPEGLSDQEQELEEYFLNLTDEEQLNLLRGCRSYDDFNSRVKTEMKKE